MVIGLISGAQTHSSEVTSAGTSPVCGTWATSHCGGWAQLGPLKQKDSPAVCRLGVPAELCIKVLVPRWCYWEVLEFWRGRAGGGI